MISQNVKPALKAHFTCGPLELQSLLADEVRGSQPGVGRELYLGEPLVTENTVSPPERVPHKRASVSPPNATGSMKHNSEGISES